MMTTDDGDPQGGHDLEVVGDRLGLAALLGPDAGIGAGRVDEADHREAELLGQLHDPEGLAVPLGVHLAEVALDPLAGRPALLMADDGHGRALVEGEAGHDRRVVGEAAVAVDLQEILGQGLDIVQGIGPLRVAGDLDDLGRGQIGLDLGPFRLDLAAEGGDFLGRAGLAGQQDRVDLLLEIEDRLLERIEIVGFVHGHKDTCPRVILSAAARSVKAMGAHALVARQIRMRVIRRTSRDTVPLLNSLAEDLEEEDRSGRSHVEGVDLPGHGDGKDPVAALADEGTQAFALRPEDDRDGLAVVELVE